MAVGKNLNNQIPKWLMNFSTSISSSDTFIQEMNRQLGMQFRDLTGLDLDFGFQLLKPFPDSFRIVQRERCNFIEGDLVGSKMGYRVEVAWKRVSEGEMIGMSDEVEGNDIQFWWSYLPVGDILESETLKSELSFDDASLSFPVNNSITVWPHLCLEIAFIDKIPENAVYYYQNLLLEAQDEWNKEEKRGKGIIHSIGEIHFIDERRLQLKIDFGSSGHEGLEYILYKLNETELEITGVGLYSY